MAGFFIYTTCMIKIAAITWLRVIAAIGFIWY
jgi:hypothetical protein